MVDVKIQTQAQRMRDRMTRLRKLHHRPGLRVELVKEELRKVLKHPSGMAFRSSGSVEWPDDTFTRRRIRDGDIKIVEAEKPKAPAPKSPRGEAA